MPAERGESWRCAAAAEAALVLAALLGCAPALHSTRLVHTWGAITYAFDSDLQRQQMIANGSYVPGNAVPFGVTADPNSDRVFLSIPSVLQGSPVTLATVENVNQVESPRLVPYPDWSWHAGGRGCDGLTSVFRSQTDDCGRLWVIDSGVVDIVDTFEQRCPPQLVVFNLTTNEMILRHRFNIPESCSGALPLNVLVDQLGDTCGDDVFAYVADPSAFSIYVYSMKNDRSWTVSSPLFFPDVNARVLNVDRVRWVLMDGVLGLAHDGRYLYFQSLSSFQEGRVPLSVMRSEQVSGTDDLFTFIGTRRYQSAAEVMSKNKVLYFHEVETNAIFCWDSRTSYKKKNHIRVEEDKIRLHFVSDMRIVRRKSQEELWAIDNNAQRVFTGQFRANVSNSVNVIRGNIVSTFGFPCLLSAG